MASVRRHGGGFETEVAKQTHNYVVTSMEMRWETHHHSYNGKKFAAAHSCSTTYVGANYARNRDHPPYYTVCHAHTHAHIIAHNQIKITFSHGSSLVTPHGVVFSVCVLRVCVQFPWYGNKPKSNINNVHNILAVECVWACVCVWMSLVSLAEFTPYNIVYVRIMNFCRAMLDVVGRARTHARTYVRRRVQYPLNSCAAHTAPLVCSVYIASPAVRTGDSRQGSGGSWFGLRTRTCLCDVYVVILYMYRCALKRIPKISQTICFS